MKRTVLFTALALTLAGPALASDQLARSLGVEAGAYSTGELIALRTALENGEHAKVNDILSGSITKGRTDSSAQFAASVGADSNYSTADVIALRSALEDSEQQTARFIRNSAGEDEGFVASTKSGISAGQAQLAASLGVDASDYSLSELVKLKADQSSDNGRGD
ncbi:hypothetical protein [Aliiruegeria sabulilitoris]|uniref:hypothetical protein n=1 Tax=Aliiruegeria sabulilitoris TaxID=1510458 RepID=UPI000836B2C4|nr:hypothetical protein [Aliiruegeria sabulilitoris]NDR59376.1 hypothetical protein [Pseudoruegeria sp. M32A2M]